MNNPTLDGYRLAKGALLSLTMHCTDERQIHRADVITALLAHALDMAHEESQSPDPTACLHEILDDLNNLKIALN